MAQINVGPQDTQLSLSQVIPASSSNVTTGILDLQAIAPNSNSWRLGRIAVIMPALPENTAGAGVTIDLKVAPPLLTTGAAAIAPNQPVPGAFITPVCAQKITIAAVAATGSPVQIAYFTLAFDPTGSTYQFYEFLITVPAINTTGEIITIGWING